MSPQLNFPPKTCGVADCSSVHAQHRLFCLPGLTAVTSQVSPQAGLLLLMPSSPPLGCYFLGNGVDVAASPETPCTSHRRFLQEPWSWCLPREKEHWCLWQCQEHTHHKEGAGQEEDGKDAAEFIPQMEVAAQQERQSGFCSTAIIRYCAGLSHEPLKIRGEKRYLFLLGSKIKLVHID